MIGLFKKAVDFLFHILGLPFYTVKYGLIYLWKGIQAVPIVLKAIGRWLLEALKESIAQIFTLLGFFIAWLTLTGSAKDIVGIAILVSISIWLLTMGLRKD
tara:strand:- start:218 stop:520 length:303 start_codon:yes stop_codon:yes gene_type:complete